MRWNPNQSVLAGIPRETLQTWLTTAQNALFLLMTGGQPVSVSYEGKSVTYLPTDSAKLSEFIQDLQAQLTGRRTRRALRPYFR